MRKSINGLSASELLQSHGINFDISAFLQYNYAEVMYHA